MVDAITKVILENDKLIKETPDKSYKFTIVLKAAGNAPILENNKYNLYSYNKVMNLYPFIKKLLGKYLGENENIFIYCNNNFSPSMSTYLGDLYRTFGVDGELIIYYALTEVWG